MRIDSFVIGLGCLVIAALLGLAVGGCDPMTTHPTVYLDASFTPEEAAAVMYGVDSWERETGGGIHFTFITVPHVELFGMAQGITKRNALFMLRQSGKIGQWCPAEAGIRTGMAGEAHRKGWSGSAAICLDADDINGLVNPHFPDLGAWAVWSVTAAHEAGHALKLDHQETIDSVMHAGAIDVTSYDVTCVDVRTVAAEWGFDVPAKCK